MIRLRRVAVTGLCLVGCGSDPGLSDYFPKLPPTGGAQLVFAGEVTDANQLLAGPAQSGLVGDFFIKNDKVVVHHPGADARDRRDPAGRQRRRRGCSPTARSS